MRVAAAIVLLSCLPVANAEDLALRRPFPLVERAVAGQSEWAIDRSAIAGLSNVRNVRFDGVAVPGLGRVSLDVTKVVLRIEERALRLDDRHAPNRALPNLSMWSGRVVGEPGSEVFLAFSPFGSRGFVAANGVRTHLDAVPGAGRDWSRSFSVWRVDDGSPQLAVASGAPFCAGALTPPTRTATTFPTPQLPAGVPTKSTSVTPIYECRVAIETDTQYYSIFGNLPAASTYLFQLLGAVSDRYREQIGVILTFPYVGFYSSSDPWVAQEQGGGSIGLLYEFQAAWQNGAGPVQADLNHFISGANLGGGVAWLPAVCDQTYGFAVSGNIGGNTPFPVAQGPINWDFMVVAHEFGHNLGAPHTHDYCPTPADECAPGGYFGACQTQQVCTSAGTIMSYCHLCSGGLGNITTYFHPFSVNDCRNTIAASCLGFYEGISYYANLGYALAGSGGTPALAVNWNGITDVLSFEITQASPFRPGILFVAGSAAYLPLYGGTLVPAVQISMPITTNGAGKVSLGAPLPPGTVSLPGGATFFAQAWISDPFTFVSATNGSEFELIFP
jgi:Metallo-peptidase family M12